MSILNGLKRIKTYVIINVIASIIAALLMIILVVKLDIIGAFYAMAINHILVFLISFIFIYKFNLINLNALRLKFNSSHFKSLTKFSLMAIMGPLCLISSTLFVRFFIDKEFGSEYAGSWEGMWRISGIYIMFLTTTFQFYLIPTFTNLSGAQLKKEVFKVWSLSIPTILIITLIVYLLKDFIIQFLFTKEFLLINIIILFHLLGDALKVNTWVLGNILVSKANTKVFIIFQIGWAIVFCSLTVLLTNVYGFIGVSIAYFITYVIHFFCMNFYFRNLLWLKPKAKI